MTEDGELAKTDAETFGVDTWSPTWTVRYSWPSRLATVGL